MPKDCVGIITLILDHVLKVQGVGGYMLSHGFLGESYLKTMIDLFVMPEDREEWLARIKELLEERRASYRLQIAAPADVDML